MMAKKSSFDAAVRERVPRASKGKIRHEDDFAKKSSWPLRACLSAPNVPDEVLISDIGRYHILSANHTTTQTYQELFQCAPFALNTWIPPHISLIARRMPGDIVSNTSDLLLSKTLFPLFQIFSGLLFPKSEPDVANECGTSNEPSRLRRPQHDPIDTPKRIVEEKTRLCLNCLHEDLETYGVAYIHLSHQIPGVQVCAKHGVPLIYKCPYCECFFKRPKKKNLVLSPWRACHCKRYLLDFPVSQEKAENLVAVSYAKFTAGLLSASPTFIKPKVLVQCYKRRLAELNYNTSGEQISRSRLLNDIEKFYGADFLGEVDAAYREQRLSGWFMLINDKFVREVPLGRHLVFAHFLFRTVAQFWRYTIHDENESIAKADRSKSEKKRSISSNRRTKSSSTPSKAERIKKLRRELISAAKAKPKCTFEYLWLENFNLMKPLMRIDAEAVPWLKEQLKTLKPRATPTRKRPIDPHPKDKETANTVRSVAEKIYASVDKPVRVSGNRLQQDLQWNPYSASRNRFPKAQRAFEEQVESNWHFYARRIVWAMLFHKGGSRSAIKIASGVEYHRALALLDFFEGLDTSVPLERGTVVAVLAKYGIDRHWMGPCPERQFLPAGRSFYNNA